MAVYLPNGTGEVLGDSFATGKPILCGGNVWYVLSTTGADAVSPAGQDRERPLATIAQAQTNATDGDVIVLLNGHSETFTAALIITKKLLIVGSGLVSGIPGARLINNSAAALLISCTTTGIEFRNIYFPTNSQANSATRVLCGQNDCKFRGCYFECGPNDQGTAALSYTGTGGIIENCTFISTATSAASRPVRGLGMSGSVSCRVIGCVFDDGTVGFSQAAFDAFGAPTNLTMEGISLLHGADLINIGISYRFSGITSTGGGRIGP